MFRIRITNDLGFEFWQDIPDYEGLYQVSTYGRVKSLGRNKAHSHRDGIIMRPFSKEMYPKIMLVKNGERKAFSVHRLVAYTFLPNPNNHPYVNHKDENKTNSRVENLEWCTPQYNSLYGTGLQKHSTEILVYDSNGNFINEYCSQHSAARELGSNIISINKCLKGTRAHFKGKDKMKYKCKYKEDA